MATTNGALAIICRDPIGAAYDAKIPDLKCVWRDVQPQVLHAAMISRKIGKSVLVAEFNLPNMREGGYTRHYQILRPQVKAWSIIKANGGDAVPRMIKITDNGIVYRVTPIWLPDAKLDALRVHGSGNIIIS